MTQNHRLDTKHNMMKLNKCSTSERHSLNCQIVRQFIKFEDISKRIKNSGISLCNLYLRLVSGKVIMVHASRQNLYKIFTLEYCLRDNAEFRRDSRRLNYSLPRPIKISPIIYVANYSMS